MKRILLVDADAETRRILATYLGRRGFLVEGASDPPLALHHIAASGPPDLIVTELFRDMADFVEALEAPAPRTPVLVWCTRPDHEARLLVESLGCEFMAKPAHPKDVAFRIARLLTGDPGADARDLTRRSLGTGGGAGSSDALFSGSGGAPPGAA